VALVVDYCKMYLCR